MPGIAAAGLTAALAAAAAYSFWRRIWFYRNPPRIAPSGNGVVSAADGTVVYVRKVEPGEPVISIKKGLAAKLSDILHEDECFPKLVVGVFMSPFDVHYNRAPISGTVEFIRHHPGRGPNLHMGPMHWRVLRRSEPYYEGAEHIVQNERTVTKINASPGDGAPCCYVVQIAAKTVAGIDSYLKWGQTVERGAVFGMIRVGSQVDVVLPWREGIKVRVRPGDRVRAGETVLCDW
ncbi:MAG TPA: phosphatidylserine decarboxylase [Burkholderiales bacterium]|nr:phosphatidylserine decarboxylase [Burkholderiales bacterium]